MSQIITEGAVVLRITPYGESDLIVRFLCAQSGKHTCLARGARKSRRRFSGVLDIGAQLQVQWQERSQSNLGTLIGATAISFQQGWTKSFETFSAVMFVLELVDQMVSERQPVEGKFRRLTTFLQEVTPERWCQQLLEWELLWLKDCGWAVDWSLPEEGGGFAALQQRLDIHLQGILGKPLRASPALYKILSA